MAVHDYVIANGTGSAVRSDLNNALAAIVSNNSSSTEPATTYAYQWWADTNANQLKIRNSANNGWIVLRELDGTMLIEDGSAGSPGLAFADDTDTGIFSNAANQIAFATGGVERLEIADSVVRFNDGGNDVDFRVESSSNTHMLFVDAGNNRLGVNENAPDNILHMTNAGDSILEIENTGNGNASGIFFVRENSSGTEKGAANIHVVSDTSRTGVELIFGVGSNTGATSGERMRITSGGDVGIGSNSPSERLEVQSGSNTTIRIDNEDDSTAKLLFHNTGSTDRQIGVTSGAMTFGGTSSEFARIDDNGKLLVGASSARTSWNNQTIGAGILQVERSGNAFATAITVTANSGTTNRTSAVSGAARLLLGRSTGTSVGSNTIVASGDVLGDVSFQGNDGAGFVEAAAIQGFCDGTPGADDMPGSLIFKTTGDGASSSTVRMKIGRAGLTDVFSTTSVLRLRTGLSGTSGQIFGGFKNATSHTNGTQSILIYANGNVLNSNNSYGQISDSKLKENIVDASSQWDNIKDVRVRNFNFIEGETHTQIGVIAQEIETVSPGLVSEAPDLDADGNDLGTTTKSVKYSVLYMKAVKALQEAMDRIETLEAKVAALEAG